MKKTNKYIAGIIFIALGILIILGNADIIRFNLWKMFINNLPAAILIGAGALFHIIFLTSRKNNAGLLVPGGILLVTGIVMHLGMTYDIWHKVWPGFILAVPFGLLELYLFDRKEKGLLIPIYILSFIGGIFLIGPVLSIDNMLTRYWPSVFVVLPGLAFHFGYIFSSKEGNEGLLVPGGIILTSGIILQLSFTFNIWHLLWPGFIAAPAIGLLELYLFSSKKEKGLLIPIGILGLISLVFFTFTGIGTIPSGIRKLIVPLALVLVGAVIILKAGTEKSRGNQKMINDDMDKPDNP